MQPGDETEDVQLMVPDLSDGSDAQAERARLRHFQREDARQVPAPAANPVHAYCNGTTYLLRWRLLGGDAPDGGCLS